MASIRHHIASHRARRARHTGKHVTHKHHVQGHHRVRKTTAHRHHPHKGSHGHRKFKGRRKRR